MILLRMLAFTPQMQKAEMGQQKTAENPRPASLRPGYNPINKSTAEPGHSSLAPSSNDALVARAKERSDGPRVFEDSTADKPRLSPGYNPENKSSPTTIATEDWPQIVSQLNLSGFALALAKNCSLKEITTDSVHLFLDPSQTALHNPKQEARLAEALSSYYTKPMRVQISVGNPTLNTPTKIQHAKESAQLAAATTALNNDTNVQAILELFDATIQPGSIQVKDSKTLPDD